MRDVVGHKALLVAACFGAALPVDLRAQPASPQALVLDLWTDFSETCVPYLANPEKALATRPTGEMGYQEYTTADRTVVHRHEGFFEEQDITRTVEVHLGGTAAMVACEVIRSEDKQPFPAPQLADALRQMTSQLPGVTMFGGDMDLSDSSGSGAALVNYYDDEVLINAYVLEGALPGRLNFIQVEIAEGLFGLYVSATISREDWQ